MTKRPQAVRARRNQSFKGRQFTAEVILSAVRWHLTLPIRYRDLEFMLLDRALSWLWRLLVGPTNVGRLRGDGDDQDGQVRNIGGSDIRAQAGSIARLFKVIA